MKKLFAHKRDARKAANPSGKPYYVSDCDIREIEEFSERVPSDASGETMCFRTKDHDIFAWWLP